MIPGRKTRTSASALAREVLNEFAGYFAVGVTSWVTGYIAAQHGLRPHPFYLGIGIAVLGLLGAIFLVATVMARRTQ